MVADDGVVEFRAAGENIHGSIGVFWPSVDGDVALGDDNNAAHTMRAECVKDLGDDGSVAKPDGFQKEGLERGGVVQQRDGAAVEFEECVACERDVHFL